MLRTSRHPGADGRADGYEGVVPLIEMRFPEKGTLLTPVFPAPTNARTFVILRLLGVLAGASWPRPPAAGCPPTRRRSATPASTAPTTPASPT